MTGFPFQLLFVEVLDNSNGSNLNEVSFEELNKCYDLSYDKMYILASQKVIAPDISPKGLYFLGLAIYFFYQCNKKNQVHNLIYLCI